jgi:hypothetical protein
MRAGKVDFDKLDLILWHKITTRICKLDSGALTGGERTLTRLAAGGFTGPSTDGAG